MISYNHGARTINRCVTTFDTAVICHTKKKQQKCLVLRADKTKRLSGCVQAFQFYILPKAHF